LEIVYTDKTLTDIAFWKRSGNRAIQTKISSLIDSISQTPYSGIGQPEALKYELTGYWSRRINQEHRIIYSILSTRIIIHSLKGHY
jgi:toxin YoeB